VAVEVSAWVDRGATSPCLGTLDQAVDPEVPGKLSHHPVGILQAQLIT